MQETPLFRGLWDFSCYTERSIAVFFAFEAEEEDTFIYQYEYSHI